MNLLGELTELLTKIPVWNELITLPRRVRALEQKLDMAKPAAEERPNCPFCQIGKLRLIDQRPDENFGILGVTRETLKCDKPACGKIVTA